LLFFDANCGWDCQNTHFSTAWHVVSVPAAIIAADPRMAEPSIRFQPSGLGEEWSHPTASKFRIGMKPTRCDALSQRSEAARGDGKPS
jgi:hypothetical protein